MYTACWQVLICSTVLAVCSSLNMLIQQQHIFTCQIQGAPAAATLAATGGSSSRDKMPQLQMPNRAVPVSHLIQRII
jgi:uncharacterized lipoprotein